MSNSGNHNTGVLIMAAGIITLKTLNNALDTKGDVGE